jgi:hypothetical protein
MPLSISPEQKLISIETYIVEKIKKTGNKIYYFIDDRDKLEEYLADGYVIEGNPIPEGHDPEKIIQRVITSWKIPTWGEHNYIISRSLKSMGEGKNRKYEVDPIRYREEKVKLLLKRWNLVDQNGHDLEVSSENIDKLPPLVAIQLLSDFEKITEPEDDEPKK